MTLSKFYVRLLAFSLVLAGLIQIILTQTAWLGPHIWGVLVFFVVLTVILFSLSVRALQMSVKNSMSIILATLMFRLFASLAYIIVYVYATGNRDLKFIAGFLILYLLFTVFEIYHLVAKLRPDSKK